MKIKLMFMLLAIWLAAPIHAQNTSGKAKEKQNNMPESAEFALNKVGQISIGVKDIDRATEFYRDKLGVKYLLKAPSVSVFDCGGITLLLSLADSNTSIIYFEVDNIQKAFETLKNRGVKMEEKPHVVGQLGKMDVWIAIFRDSEENLLSLRSTKPTAKAR